MKKRYLILIMILLVSNLLAEIKIMKPTKRINHSFAIVIDDVTYNKTEKAVIAYRDAIESDGLACYIMIEKDANPEEIKKEVQKLYKKEKTFEGIVLIGDVPVPMIRDAHHLSSAFKMDPKRGTFVRSSIASDRFYDDFDLKFDFLKQDTTDATLFYYSLTSKSVQVIDKEIYSARIKAPVKGEEKYKLISEYLERVAKQKQKTHEIKNIMTFAGHGYHSEALAAWEWDNLVMKDLFPQLHKPGHGIKSLNQLSSSDMKKIILTELQKPSLDIALFHAHGGSDAQYLNGFPLAMNVDENIYNIKYYLRSKLRQAKRWKRDPEVYKKGYMEKFGVPEDWFDGAFEDSVIKADSIYNADLDIYASDLDGIKTQPKFVMFDQCYNGQFIKTPYIAGKYIFSGGRTIVSVANTVNVKQDIWANEFLGMLNLGARVGQWHKTRVFLESHLIGDPTFHFYEIPKKLVKNLYSNKNESYWLQQLKSENPVFREIAIRQLFEINRAKYSKELVNIYYNDESSIVRLQALKCLAKLRTKDFENILYKTAQDPAEMIRRITSIWMTKVGHAEYLPYLANMVVGDHSERVNRQAKESMGTIDPDKAIVEIQKVLDKLPSIADKEKFERLTIGSFKRNHNWLYDELIFTLNNDTMSIKEKKRNIRTFRNYNFHLGVDALIDVMLNNNSDPEVRIMIAEALGWFTFSYRRDEIIDACNKILVNKNIDEKLFAEVEKTKKRLIAGSNAPITP